MAHFAQIDSNNTVVEVIVVDSADCLDESGNESEAVGIRFCRLLKGEDTRWLQTSYTNRIRGRFAGVGMLYDEVLDEFIEAPYEHLPPR